MKTVIDVSEYNGRIDWPKVKVDGAILRVGYRGYGSSGTLVTDKRLMENMQGALASGLPIGAYFLFYGHIRQRGQAGGGLCCFALKGL